MMFTEELLNKYALPLSETEEQQCKNAIRMVVDAIKPLGFEETRSTISPMVPDTPSFFQELKSLGGTRRIKVFVQGSYANNTNVRTQSDVDIAIVEENIFITKYREGGNDSAYGFEVVKPRVLTFKDEIEELFKRKFPGDVERKNKSIKINGNTYRKDADGVPCKRYKDFSKDYWNDPENYVKGIIIFADDGERIVNYPEQHIANGKEKNVATNYYYKKMVRIIKKMRLLMQESKVQSAENVSSFALESLMWNIPTDEYLELAEYRKVYMFDRLVDYLNANIRDLPIYKEANGIKDLCLDVQKLNQLSDFIRDLRKFYNYQ
ncbi:nucleotidyltransferase [Exiguobacterium sp. SH5S13]|uniref:nucleotidyltransferase domain-containing protein n=1 Tax=Exiguobacterium sp. SH5S13 TaxID=2510959 RepID=UPI00103E7C50|nr:nucleotidyltransferase [Exiguobacterium sp. SH5S13]TCI50344.1 nucleotidyltransferase [Exiguobacterium sp. SH5S13]